MKECPKCKREWEDKVLFCPLDGQPLIEKINRDPFIGALLDNKYRLTEKVGEGGYGTVYKATHIEIDSTVAVKILHPHLASDKLTIERFRREARAAAQIRHPNAVVVTDFGVTKDEGTAYLVMEFLEGIDLRSKIKQQKQLDYPEAILIIAQACEAVHAAHLKGIIHRDLKPDNIWLTKSDDAVQQVKVLDFGIAKLKAGTIQSSSNAVALTQQGMIIGTPHYMSPEQGRGEELDARSDVYSLGVILYEMVTGKVPFNGKTALDVVLKHNTNPPVAPGQLRADVPERLEQIILCALEKKQENRQDSALRLAEELESLLFDFGVPLNQLRKKNSQFGMRNMASGISSQSGAGDASTKAFNSGKTDWGASETRDDGANQTLPRSDKVTARPAASLATAANEPRQTPQAAGKATDGVVTSSPERNKKLVLYAGLAVVALMVAVFAVIKLLPNNPAAPNANNANTGNANTAGNRPPKDMILVRGGKFIMGTDNAATEAESFSTPAHEVEVRSFYLDTTEVTNEDYYQFIKATNRPAPSHWKDGEPEPGETKLPVTNISWNDANEYAKYIEKRLPSEAEWEYAARGTGGSIYPWGNSWDPKCSNSREDEAGGTKPVAVGSYKNCPSWCGVYDLAGNVAEWVADDFKLYENSRAKPQNGEFRIYRGGGYNFSRDEIKNHIRWFGRPYMKEMWLGFRCAKDLAPGTSPDR